MVVEQNTVGRVKSRYPDCRTCFVPDAACIDDSVKRSDLTSLL